VTKDLASKECELNTYISVNNCLNEELVHVKNKIEKQRSVIEKEKKEKSFQNYKLKQLLVLLENCMHLIQHRNELTDAFQKLNLLAKTINKIPKKEEIEYQKDENDISIISVGKSSELKLKLQILKKVKVNSLNLQAQKESEQRSINMSILEEIRKYQLKN